MALMCYNKGCGEKFDAGKNSNEACLFHPGVPIFHDALKGWSCCRKRTTDFSEFLSIKGCTRGRHSNEKPQEPLKPEVSSEKGDQKQHNGVEIIYQGPKSAETLQKERPSPDEPKTKLPLKVSPSLSQLLEKMEITQKEEAKKQESQMTVYGTRCKNPGCKSLYKGLETNIEECIHHPGAPVFHEGYKYWSCCCIKTIDFNAFLDQKGCTSGRHRWIPRQDKKKVACRYDWHQTGGQVVVTIYAKNSHPEHSYVETNRTVLTCHIQFENDKIFHKDFHLWGVAEVGRSYVNMLPSKVEVSLCKADAVAWGKLEDPNFKPEPEPAGPEDIILPATDQEPVRPDWDIDDDDISEDSWGEDVEEEMRRQMGEVDEDAPPELEELKDTPELKKKK